MKICFWLCKILDSLKSRFQTFIYGPYQCSQMGNCGNHTVIGAGIQISNYQNLYIGNDCYIGPEAFFLNAKADIRIGNKVMFGPQVAIITGNHRIDVIGKYMADVTEKLPENDMPVHIEDDVWVGMRAMILKGVTVGHGSVIAAGATVIRDVPPYSIYLSKDRILPRFTKDQIEEHETKMKLQ